MSTKKKILIADSKGWFSVGKELKRSAVISYVTQKSELSLQAVKEIAPDIIFFVHWSWIVPNEIHKNYQSIVFHTAPLPHGRGGSPIQNLILAGYDFAPVCAIKMTDKLDAGPIYAKKEISLEGSLADIFSRISHAINYLIGRILTENLTPLAQDGDVHVFRRLTEEDNKIRGEMSLEEIYDRIRMVDANGYLPAFIELGGVTIQLCEAKLEGNRLYAKCTLKK